MKKGINEDNIIVDTQDIPIISYVNPYTSKISKYFPDIYIPSQNKIIEVKSQFTYDVYKKKNETKWQTTADNGFSMEIYIYNGKGRCIDEMFYI